jgi:iron(II)-dependent oxidoreductase
MVVQHEHQHDETMLATLNLMAAPGYRPALMAPPVAAAPVTDEVLVMAGPFVMGTSDEPWAYDNERPGHVVDLPAYWIDAAPVTNGEYAAFVAAGGYDDRAWWEPEGWAWRQEADLEHPQGWRRAGAGWERTRFGCDEPLPSAEPVQHVCWYEAEAYARWAGKRLPTEAEWEKAAAWDPFTGRHRRYPWGDEPPTGREANLDQRHFGPAPVGAYPAGASAYGCVQMLGDVWEWTASDFRPYPGFASYPYREYSEVFFGPEYKVLRGGSWATHPTAARTTFRNWDYPIRRQIFAGFRCARDAENALR